MKIYKVEEVDTQGFIFPDASSQCDGIISQCKHIVEEVFEAMNPLCDDDMLVELYDIIHAVETLIRYLDYDEEQRMEAILNVISKNSDRGYYGE